MIDFAMLIEEELEHQRKLYAESRRLLQRAPDGALRKRKRKEGAAFYLYYKENGRVQEKNITENKELIERLLKKRIQKKIRDTAKKNCRYLEMLSCRYASNDLPAVLETLPRCYRDASVMLSEAKAIFQKNMQRQGCFDPAVHIHETASGLWVRSKSEVIIANSLTSYNIPFYYEKEFPHRTEDGRRIWPDFTFELPSGEEKLWEHLGLMNNPEYCIHNAYKLNQYQLNGFYIGRNLIITQDDCKGNCSSGFIDETIRLHLLPYYR